MLKESSATLAHVSPTLLADFFDHLPEAVVVADAERRIRYANPAAEALFGYRGDEWIGRQTSMLYATPDDFAEQGQKRYNRFSRIGMQAYRIRYRCADGTVFLAHTSGGAMRDERDQLRGFIGLVRPAEAAEKTVDTLQRLHAITASTALDEAARIDEILTLGARHFGLDLAVQSRIRGEDFRVEHCLDPTHGINPGDSFPLSGTYCVHTLKAHEPIGFHHAGESEIRVHPCYREFGLEAYIGCPIQVDGEVHGTLNFSSLNPCRPFSRDDLIFMQLLADSVGHEIHQQMMRKQLSAQARIDELTGLSNRRAVMETLEWQVAHSQRSGLPLTVLLLDLDYFKRINDTWGHGAGDAVLRAFARLLMDVGREVDLCGRLGGEEFILMLPDTTAEGGRALGQRLREQLAGTTMAVAADQRITASLSGGLAALTDSDTVESLLKRADQALYAAKQSGRDRICEASS